MAKPLLSLCMIVKDGGASLTRCLDSVRGVVDEIVVVDTGSRDDSVARARAAGATVIERPWDDDFAAARNAGLEVARGEWILLLDCDEHFVPPRPAGLRAALQRAEYLGYFLPVASDLAGGERLDSTILRLWRHAPDVRFRFPIHEQVLPDLERMRARTGQRFALLDDLRVVHDGYLPDAIAAHGKVERNLKLFKKGVAQHPEEPYLWYKFADFLRGQAQDKQAARPVAERALALAEAAMARGESPPPYWAELLAIACASRLESGDRDQALELVALHPPLAQDSPAYSYVAALAREAAGEIDLALAHVAECTGARRRTHQTAWRPGLAGPQAEALAARLWLKKGDATAAIAAAERALSARPGYPAAVQLKADALVVAQRAGDAVKFLLAEAKARPDASRVWQQLGALLTRLGQPDQAQKCLARANAGFAASGALVS